MSGHRARMMLQLIAEQTNNFSGGLISEVAAEEQNIDEFCCDNDSSSIQEAERDKPLDTLESEREIDSLCQSNQNIESDVINEIGYASNQEVASHTKVNVENNTYDPHDDTNANNCAGSSSQNYPSLMINTLNLLIQIALLMILQTIQTIRLTKVRRLPVIMPVKSIKTYHKKSLSSTRETGQETEKSPSKMAEKSH